MRCWAITVSRLPVPVSAISVVVPMGSVPVVVPEAAAIAEVSIARAIVGVVRLVLLLLLSSSPPITVVVSAKVAGPVIWHVWRVVWRGVVWRSVRLVWILALALVVMPLSSELLVVGLVEGGARKLSVWRVAFGRVGAGARLALLLLSELIEVKGCKSMR